MQDYPPPPTGANGKAKGIPTYPVTLLWYPRIRRDSDPHSVGSWTIAIAQNTLLPARGSSPEYQRYTSISEAEWEEIARPAASTGLPESVNPALNSKGKGKEKEKVAHKRQISEAIPRNERDNGGLSRPQAAPARTQEGTQEGTQGGTQAAGQEGTQKGTRKSVRARKPKSRE
jgi:flagellar biosynthesis/type III secretory pathway protein FliH